MSAQASDANFPEILNYQVKESDLVGDREWFLELTRQLHRSRAIAVGGILRQYMRELEEKNQDLIDESEERDEADKASLSFRWKHKLQKYKIKKYLRVIKINRLIYAFKHHLCL
ncbi:protein rep [Nostoc sp. CALU 1950]|uniref:protein rep n=1 Tax=Nostoc sp. CALU 1950 TaxID=3104321 RepID=UPI003EBF98CC